MATPGETRTERNRRMQRDWRNPMRLLAMEIVGVKRQKDWLSLPVDLRRWSLDLAKERLLKQGVGTPPTPRPVRERLPAIPREFRAVTVRAAERERHDPHGFVYVLVHPCFPGFCKIGWARDLNKRLSEYNVGDPNKRYRMSAWGYFADAEAAEGSYHASFAAARIKGGEWFEAVEKQAALAIIQDSEAGTQ